MISDADKLLRGAKEALALGNLALAEMFSHDVLEIEANNAHALNILGLTALKVGMPQHALRYFKKSLKSEPTDIAAAHVRSLNGVKGQSPIGERYLVIKSWSHGFAASVSHTLGGLLLAEITGRTPVVEWGDGCLYRDEGTADAFTKFFRPISSLGINDLDGADVYPVKWRNNLTGKSLNVWSGEGSRVAPLYLLARPEKVIVSDFYASVVSLLPWISRGHVMYGKPIDRVLRYLMNKYLRPTSAVEAEVNNFIASHFGKQPFASIHLRGTDKELESNLKSRSGLAIEKLAAIDPECPVFLMSDDTNYVEIMKSRFGARVVTADATRASASAGVHLSPTSSKERLGREVLVDALIAMRANYFIGDGASNLAAMIACMREPADCFLVWKSGWHVRHFALYTTAL